VLICPTPIAMRKLHIICDTFASKYDIVFDADKSKFFIVVPTRWRNLCDSFNQCVFISGVNLLRKLLHTHILGILLVLTWTTLLMLCTDVAISLVK
jgi:hypothetical protein